MSKEWSGAERENSAREIDETAGSLNVRSTTHEVDVERRTELAHFALSERAAQTALSLLRRTALVQLRFTFILTLIHSLFLLYSEFHIIACYILKILIKNNVFKCGSNAQHCTSTCFWVIMPAIGCMCIILVNLN